MKIVERKILGDAYNFRDDPVWFSAQQEIERAISCVVWPEGANDFSIYPKKDSNGVVPIKVKCLESLKADGWQVEQLFDIPGDMKPGKVDAQKRYGETLVLFEWETGNISSSHRALNKLSIGIKHTSAAAGVLVVPDQSLAKYITDRVGNVRELRPYFEIWEEWADKYGLLAIYVVAQDREDLSTPVIPKGSDGRAKEYRRRLEELRAQSHPLLTEP